MSCREVCENCDGEGYTDMGASACAVCLGVGVTTPEMLAALGELTRLRAGVTEIIAGCEHGVGVQKFNRENTTDKRSKAYAEGRETAYVGVLARLTNLLALPAPATPQEETP